MGDAKDLRETARWIFLVLIGSEVYSIVTYLLSENLDDGNSDCCASAVVTKMEERFFQNTKYHFTDKQKLI